MGKKASKPTNGTGINWVRECLNHGEAFSREVGTKLDIEDGQVWLLAVDPTHEKAFSTGVAFSQAATQETIIDTSYQAGVLLDGLRRLEGKAGNLAALVEDNLRFPGEALLGRFPSDELLEFRGRILHVKPLASFIDGADFRRFLGCSSGYPLNAFVVPRKAVANRGKIDRTDADSLALSVMAIINSAYDNETYTLWQRRRAPDVISG